MTLSRFAPIIAAAWLAGCTVPVAPGSSSALEGLVSPGTVITTGAPEQLRGARGKRLGIVISNSTETNLEYVEKYLSALKSNALNRYDESAQLLRPNYFIEKVSAALKAEFRSTKIIPNLRNEHVRQVDIVVLVNISVRYPDNWVPGYGFSVEADFFDNALRRLGQAKGSASDATLCYSWTCVSATSVAVMQRGLVQFQQELQGLTR